MSSKLSIISNALVMLGDVPLQSLDDTGAGAEAGRQLYDSVLQNNLSICLWRFARRQRQLNQTVAEPLFDYDKQYQLPADYIQAVQVDQGRDFRLNADKLMTNYDEVNLEYIAKVDESNMPPYFVTLMEYAMAIVLAIPVTENATARQQFLVTYADQRAIAMARDSMQERNVQIKSSPFAQARRGNIRRG